MLGALARAPHTANLCISVTWGPQAPRWHRGTSLRIYSLYTFYLEKLCLYRKGSLPPPHTPANSWQSHSVLASSGFQRPPVTVSRTPQGVGILLVFPGSFFFPRIPHYIRFLVSVTSSGDGLADSPCFG